MLPLTAAVGLDGICRRHFCDPCRFSRLLVGIVPRRFGLSQRRHWYMVGADFGLASLQLALLITLVALKRG